MQVAGEDGLCGNCAAEVIGRYCPACGQLTASFHRPFGALLAEGLGDFFALDGRVARTLPKLMFLPGRLTRDFLDGKRARFVPPFRLYLLSSLLFFLLFFTLANLAGWTQPHRLPPPPEEASVETLESGEAPAGNGPVISIAGEQRRLIRPDGTIDRESMIRQIDLGGPEAALLNRLADAYENQPLFYASLQRWAPQLAVLLLPVLICALTLVFAFRRSVYIYDHVIFALHAQSWMYLTLCAVVLLALVGHGWVALGLFIAPPLYLFMGFRTAYQSGILSGIFRTIFCLGVMTITLLVLVIALIALGVVSTSPSGFQTEIGANAAGVVQQ